ncbi:hypothetical protein GT204_11615 [Streptomyces sp. SID4919]|uniref:hypothetical protein n=1 Tax=unclassified Streptomyces TaxID=2593676 RepID=UPI000823DD85|nr:MULTISPECIES: hypothetical protein [unclassified Streptomyces]MYY09545.1 hypothetical protein [Streptomyces sp. SID4919]SCK63015.1 hypothetical protein YW7DRAFT_06937 [Streptomyces sp. AmelKG-E11A]
MSVAHESAPAAGPPLDAADAHRQELDGIWAAGPFAEAAARTEHLLAVLPLLDLFPHDPDGHVSRARSGERRAALGLFTPNSEFALPVPAVHAERSGDGRLTLTGRFRYASEDAELSLLWLRVVDEDATRLALLPHTHEGLRRYGAGRAEGWGWIELDGVTVEEDVLSHPVSWAPEGPLSAVFDGYAWEFSRRSLTWSAGVVADLRRELALTGSGTEALSTSQYLAHELSKLEIEVSLAVALASFGAEFKAEEPGGTSVGAALLASTDLLSRTVQVAEDMSTELGLADSAVGAAGWPTGTVQAWFGGRRMAGGELARRMGLVPKDVRS